MLTNSARSTSSVGSLPLTLDADLKARRFSSLCRSALVRFRDDAGLWRALNISDRGMMLSSRVGVDPGEVFTISLSDEISLTATAIWNETGRCGVEFKQPVDSADLLRSLAAWQQSRRFRPLRMPIYAKAVATDDTGMHPIVLRDLSLNGMGVWHLGDLRKGRIVHVRLGQKRRGVVRWSNGRQAGLLLLDPFAPEELERASQVALLTTA